MKKLHYTLILLVLTSSNSIAQNFKITAQGIFTPQKQKVVLFNDTTAGKKMILFQTTLRVNTDGTPMSYHPYDLYGKEKALNTIANGVAIYSLVDGKKIKVKRTDSIVHIFERWRDSKYEVMPQGYNITWKNVLAATNVNGKVVPCVIDSGEYAGYFSSLTSLQNGLKPNKKLCDCNNQVNPLKIPGLVLAGGKNIVQKFGAQVGDLVIAYNPDNNNLVYAIINDGGPEDNLGEGSVLLNMKLLNKTEFPKKIKDTYGLGTTNKIMITIIPKSKNYNLSKPYSAENVQARIQKWMKESGFETEQKFIDFLKQNRNSLN